MSAPKPNPSAIVQTSNNVVNRATESLRVVADLKPQVSKGLQNIEHGKGGTNNTPKQPSKLEKGGNQR